MPNNSSKTLDDIWSLVKSPVGIAIISYLAGLVTAFVTPWVQWFFKRKEIELNIKTNNRKEKIQQWRNELSKHMTFASFSMTSTFHELKHRVVPWELEVRFSPYSKDNSLLGIEHRKLERSYEVITEIEKEWKII